MKKLYCCKCKEYKNNWQYANPYNSTKFCYDCGVALEEKTVENPELVENPYNFIFEGLHNAVNRLITRYSNEGDRVLDPFGGIGTVPKTAIKMGRYGIGIELNPDYFRDGVAYCKAEEDAIDTPTLFDIV